MRLQENKRGDTRTITKFLFVPVTLPVAGHGEERRWLESANIKQEWDNWAGEGWRWHDRRWA